MSPMSVLLVELLTFELDRDRKFAGLHFHSQQSQGGSTHASQCSGLTVTTYILMILQHGWIPPWDIGI